MALLTSQQELPLQFRSRRGYHSRRGRGYVPQGGDASIFRTKWHPDTSSHHVCPVMAGTDLLKSTQAACNTGNPECDPVFWQMQHCPPSLRLQLPESLLTAGTKHPPLCLSLSNFPLSLVHSVSFVWGDTGILQGMILHRKCSVSLQSCCSELKLRDSEPTGKSRWGSVPDGVLCQSLYFCPYETETWSRQNLERELPHVKRHTQKKKKASSL